jgi:hypothetical protein
MYHVLSIHKLMMYFMCGLRTASSMLLFYNTCLIKSWQTVSFLLAVIRLTCSRLARRTCLGSTWPIAVQTWLWPTRVSMTWRSAKVGKSMRPPFANTWGKFRYLQRQSQHMSFTCPWLDWWCPRWQVIVSVVAATVNTFIRRSICRFHS